MATGAVRITNRPGGMCYLCEVLLCQLKVCVANSTKRPHGNFTSTEKCSKRTIAARNEVRTYTKGYVGRPKGTSDIREEHGKPERCCKVNPVGCVNESRSVVSVKVQVESERQSFNFFVSSWRR